jgi:hypothetical protein
MLTADVINLRPGMKNVGLIGGVVTLRGGRFFGHGRCHENGTDQELGSHGKQGEAPPWLSIG